MAREQITDAQREQLQRRRDELNEPQVPIDQQYFWHRLAEPDPAVPAEPQQISLPWSGSMS
jgi:hypothetical protein